MKRILAIVIVALSALFFWRRDHMHRIALEATNAHLRAQIEISKAERLRIDSTKAEKETRLEELRRQVASEREDRPLIGAQKHSEPTVMVPVPPDSAHRGGWSKNQGFLYFPKELLGQVDYRPVENRRITDESAALFGMSEKERTAADAAIQKLFGGFRQLELAQMRPVDPPDAWKTSSLSEGSVVQRAIAYEIPELSNEATTLAQSFKSELRSMLGEARASSFQEAVDAYTLNELEDLGRQARRVGFVWFSEPNGATSLWYATGEGSFQRVPDDVPADSRIAYYAGLFGVELPKRPVD